MIALTLTAPGSLEQLALQEIPDPHIVAPDEVRVRIHAAALNHLDLFVVGGLPHAPPLPFVVGSDGAGTVDAVGAAVRGVAVGSRVMLNPGVSCNACEWCGKGEHSLCPTFRILGEHRPGTIAEYVVVPARNLGAVPPGMSWEEAAAFPLATLTAWRMLVTRAKLQQGETVLIWGIGGGVAQAALRIATHLGARAIVTSTSEEKLARARAMGAAEALNSRAVDVAAEIRKLTAKRGVEVVVDSIGQATWESSLRCLARGGRLVTCGGTSGPQVGLDVRKLFWYQWDILGSTMGNEAEWKQIVELAGQGRLRPEVDSVVPLARAVDGYRRLAS
ncbi:MAG TPA: zinc-binding dehydrogenase, partial [Gemmatimonadales bacterium]|nr:zinc-binding dehydrogenase [Gemmatimonadales bacterium]